MKTGQVMATARSFAVKNGAGLARRPPVLWFSQASANEPKKKTITLFASQVASCVRMNKYEPIHKAVEKMWAKNFPESFNAAVEGLKRQDITVLTPEEKVHVAVERRGFTEPVAKLKEEANKAVTASAAFSIMAKGTKELARAVDVQATKVAEEEMKATSGDADTQKAVSQDLTLNVPLEEKLVRVQEKVEHLPDEEQAAVVQPLKAAIEDHKVIGDDVRKDIFTNFGTRTETPAMQVFAERYNKAVRTEDKFFVKKVGETSTGVPVLFGGKVDGFAADQHGGPEELVEIKNRMKRMFPSIPSYEQVQTQVLLEVTGVERGVLVQSRRLPAEHQLQVTPFHRQEALLPKIVIPRAIAFARTLIRLHEDEELAMRLLRAGDNEAAKVALVAELMRESSAERGKIG